MNSQKIALLTDSCADIPAHLCEKYGIFVLPLRLLFKDGEFLDGVTITPHQVYQRIQKELPTTSLPSGEMVQNIFIKLKDMGYKKVLAVHLSSGLSGTCNLVQLLGDECQDLEVCVFDSKSGSLGIGLMLLQAAKLIQKGYDWEQLLQAVSQMIAGTKVFFCIDTLEYLQKGGRIGKVQAIAGSLLQIKPIISFTQNGELESVAKGRGHKAALQKMIDLFCQAMPKNQKFVAAVVDGDSPQEGDVLLQLLKPHLPQDTQIFRGQIDCTLASYVGPGLLGIGFQIIPDI